MKVVTSSQYRADIDGLRAIAVLSILLFHLEINGFSGGFVGVDVFFVISGFLITRLIKDEIEERGHLSFKKFYVRRIRRLFPALFSTLVFTTCVAAFLLSPAHLNSYGGSLTSALASVSNIYFWMEADYFDVSARLKPLLHTWSLSVEEQFYLFWPVTLYLLSKIRKQWLPFWFLLGTVLLSLYLNQIFSDGSVQIIKKYSPTLAYYISNGRSTIFFHIPFRLFEFAIGGMLVWLLGMRIRSAYIRELLFIAGIGLVLYSVLFFNENMMFPSYYALVPCVGTGLLILVGKESKFSIIVSNRLFVWLGLISYSLYLVHWPLIVFWSYMAGDLQWADQILLFIVSIILAFINYRYIECPFRYQKVKINGYGWQGTLGLTILLVGSVGLHMKANYGWPWRTKSPVVFENVGDAAKFHISFYGGTGYPFYGPVNTVNPPDLVLMGDSHGRQYAEGIYKEWAEPEGLNLYMASGSSFLHLPLFTRKTEGYDWASETTRRMDEALSFINQAEKPPVVILSHFWLAQMQKADLVDKQGKRRNIDIDIENVITGINMLKQSIGDSTLIVIGEVPGPGVNLYDVFTRPIPPFSSGFKPEDYLFTPVNMHQRNFNDQLSEISMKSGDFIFFDPFTMLCENDVCRNTDSESRLMYSDTHHLSKYGSREVVKLFLPEFKKAYRENHKNGLLVSFSDNKRIEQN